MPANSLNCPSSALHIFVIKIRLAVGSVNKPLFYFNQTARSLVESFWTSMVVYVGMSILEYMSRPSLGLSSIHTKKFALISGNFF